jgi:hypothetical protein
MAMSARWIAASVIKFAVDLAERAHGAVCLERSRVDVEI